MSTIWGLPSILLTGRLLNASRHYELCLETRSEQPLTESRHAVKHSEPKIKAKEPQIVEKKSTPSPSKKKKKRKVEEEKGQDQDPLPASSASSSKQMVPVEEVVAKTENEIPENSKLPDKPSSSSTVAKTVVATRQSPPQFIGESLTSEEIENEIHLESEAFSKEISAAMMDYYNKWSSYIAEVLISEEQKQQQLTQQWIEEENAKEEPNPPGFTPPPSPQPPFRISPEGSAGSYSYQQPYYQPAPSQPYWEDEYRPSPGAHFSASSHSDSADYYGHRQPQSVESRELPFLPPPFPPFPDSSVVYLNNSSEIPPPPPPPFGFNQQAPPPPENNWLNYDQPHYENAPVIYNGGNGQNMPSPPGSFHHFDPPPRDYDFCDQRSYDSSYHSRYHEPDYYRSEERPSQPYRGEERPSQPPIPIPIPVPVTFPPPPPPPPCSRTDTRSFVSMLFSPDDCDYRAVWVEQVNGRYAPANHPFYHVESENVLTKPYSDVFQDDEQPGKSSAGVPSPWNNLPPFRDALLYKPGTWHHLRDIPKFTRDNLQKLSEQEARAFVEWFRNERRESFHSLWTLQKRIDTSLKAAISLEAKCQRNYSEQTSNEDRRGVVRTLPYEPASELERRAIAERFAITDPAAFRLERRERSHLQTVWSSYWASKWESPDAARFALERDRFLTKLRNGRSESQRAMDRESFKHFQREFDKINKKDMAKFDGMMVDAIVENGKTVEQILTSVIDQINEGRVPKLRSFEPPSYSSSKVKSTRPASPQPSRSKGRKRSRSPLPPPLLPSSRRPIRYYNYGDSGRRDDRYDRGGGSSYYSGAPSSSNYSYGTSSSYQHSLPPLMQTGSRYYNI